MSSPISTVSASASTSDSATPPAAQTTTPLAQTQSIESKPSTPTTFANSHDSQNSLATLHIQSFFDSTFCQKDGITFDPHLFLQHYQKSMSLTEIQSQLSSFEKRLERNLLSSLQDNYINLLQFSSHLNQLEPDSAALEGLLFNLRDKIHGIQKIIQNTHLEYQTRCNQSVEIQNQITSLRNIQQAIQGIPSLENLLKSQENIIPDTDSQEDIILSCVISSFERILLSLQPISYIHPELTRLVASFETTLSKLFEKQFKECFEHPSKSGIQSIVKGFAICQKALDYVSYCTSIVEDDHKSFKKAANPPLGTFVSVNTNTHRLLKKGILESFHKWLYSIINLPKQIVPQMKTLSPAQKKIFLGFQTTQEIKTFLTKENQLSLPNLLPLMNKLVSSIENTHIEDFSFEKFSQINSIIFYYIYKSILSWIDSYSSFFQLFPTDDLVATVIAPHALKVILQTFKNKNTPNSPSNQLVSSNKTTFPDQSALLLQFLNGLLSRSSINREYLLHSKEFISFTKSINLARSVFLSSHIKVCSDLICNAQAKNSESWPSFAKEFVSILKKLWNINPLHNQLVPPLIEASTQYFQLLTESMILPTDENISSVSTLLQYVNVLKDTEKQVFTLFSPPLVSTPEFQAQLEAIQSTVSQTLVQPLVSKCVSTSLSMLLALTKTALKNMDYVPNKFRILSAIPSKTPSSYISKLIEMYQQTGALHYSQMYHTTILEEFIDPLFHFSDSSIQKIISNVKQQSASLALLNSSESSGVGGILVKIKNQFLYDFEALNKAFQVLFSGPLPFSQTSNDFFTMLKGS